MFYYYSFSNFNNLLDSFLDHLTGQINQQKNLFEPLFIVVENHYTKKYLQLEIAKKIGISANIRFLYINEFIDFIHSKTIEKKEINFLEKNYLEIIIQKIIKENIKNPLYKEIKNYLQNTSSNQFYDLSLSITDLFDKYIFFCGDQLIEWSSEKKTKTWQCDIWQKITTEYDTKLALQKLSLVSGFFNENTLSENFFFFNYNELPIFLIDFFQKNKEQKNIQFYFYCLNILPLQSNSYTEKIEEQKEVYQQISSNRHFDIAKGISEKRETNQKKLLKKFKQNIFFEDKKNYPEATLDHSIQIGHFLSKKREIERLKEKILFWLNQKIKMEEILIICQNIEEYQPIIDMVFNRDFIIPYNIELQKENQLWKNFLSLLTLLEETFFFKNILSFLQDIDEKDSDFFLALDESIKIKNWLNQNKTFHNYKADIFGDKWQKLIQNFLEKYLIDEKQEYSFIEINIFQKLLRFYNKIISYQKQISNSKKVETWIEVFKFIFKNFFKKNFQNENDYLQCLATLEKQKEMNQQLENESKFLFQEIIYSLKRQKIKSYHQENFMKKGINFINTFKFNGFNFQTVAMIGINDDFFTHEKKVSFDILNFSKKRDYDIKDKEYYFFLMSIFYAQSFFYISFINEKKGKIIPFIIKDLLLKFKQVFPSISKNDFIESNFSSGNEPSFYLKDDKYYPFYFTQIAEKVNKLQNSKEIINQKTDKKEIIDEIENQKKIQAEKPILKKSILLEDIINYYKNPIQHFQKKQLFFKPDYIGNDIELYDFPEDKFNSQFSKLYRNFNEVDEVDENALAQKSILPVDINHDIFFEKYKDMFDCFKREEEFNLKNFHQEKIKKNLQIEGFEIYGELDCHINKNQELKLFTHSVQRNNYSQLIEFFCNFLFLACNSDDKENYQVNESILLDLINKQKLTIKKETLHPFDINGILIKLIDSMNKAISSNNYLFCPPKSTHVFFIEYIKQKVHSKKENSALKKAFEAWQGNHSVMGEKDYSNMKYFFDKDISEESFQQKIMQAVSPFLLLMNKIKLEKI